MGIPHNVESIGVSFSTNTPNPYTGEWLHIDVTGLGPAFGLAHDFHGDLTSEEKQPGSFLPKFNKSHYTVGQWTGGKFYTNKISHIYPS